MTKLAEKTEYKKGYKKTKLGWIPQDWKILALKEISDRIIGGGTPSTTISDFWSGNIPWISSADIINNGEIIPKRFITEKAVSNSATNIIPKNSVIVVTRVGLGKISISKYPLCTSQDFQSIILNKNKAYFGFVKYLLTQKIEKITKQSQGSTIQGITKPQLSNMALNIPPLAEQQKIVEVLTTWDETIEILEKLIEKKQIFKKALMQKMLVGKDKLKKCLKEISIKNNFNEIQNVLSVTNSRGFINQDEQFERVVASKNLKTYKVVKKGQFAYNPSRINVGSIGLLTSFECGIVSPIYVVFETIEDKLLKDYFKHYFQTPNFFEQMKAYTQGGVRDNLNFKSLQMMKINIPSIKKQQEIANILNTCDEEIKLLNFKLEKLKQQKKGLMQKLLTGQVRVKN